jgi:hypothetical protein
MAVVEALPAFRYAELKEFCLPFAEHLAYKLAKRGAMVVIPSKDDCHPSLTEQQ